MAGALLTNVRHLGQRTRIITIKGASMPNFNDAEITAIYVSHTASAGVQDDAPNAPTAGDRFDVTLEMVAGYALNTSKYTLTVSCADLTAWKPAPAGMIPTTPPFDKAGSFGGAGWKTAG